MPRSIPRTHRARRQGPVARLLVLNVAVGAGLVTAHEVRAQEPTGDSASVVVAPEEAVVPPPAAGLPGFLTIGLGYGQRFDPCAQCSSRFNVESFTGHLSVGKYLQEGLGIGVDISVWRRGHPGTPGAPDSLGVPAPTTLVNQLGNASLTFSIEHWQVFARGGVGVALGRQDLQDSEGVVTVASGIGLGYSIGGGIKLPIASMVSLALFANWNAGSYDLSTPALVLERGVRHEYVEIGFGLTVR